MNAREAKELDRKDEKIQVYEDEEEGILYLFGLNSGFAYASPGTYNIQEFCDDNDFVLIK